MICENLPSYAGAYAVIRSTRHHHAPKHIPPTTSDVSIHTIATGSRRTRILRDYQLQEEPLRALLPRQHNRSVQSNHRDRITESHDATSRSIKQQSARTLSVCFTRITPSPSLACIFPPSWHWEGRSEAFQILKPGTVGLTALHGRSGVPG